MSISNTVKKFRLESVLKNFGSSVFLTLTTPDKCDLLEIRRRWRIFRHDYFRAIKKPKYVMIYEPHPSGHGWHIHAVIEDAFLPVSFIRQYAGRACFGRIHVERVLSGERVAGYLTKYLFKSIRSASVLGVKRVRLVNMSRGLTRLADIEQSGALLDCCREMAKSNSPLLAGMLPVARYRFCLYYVLFGYAFSSPDPTLDYIMAEKLLC